MTPRDFSPNEVLAIAKEMEQEGLAFYKAVAKAMSDPDVKAMFLKLASDEVQHVRDIERLEEHAGEYFPSQEDWLVAQYVQGIVDTKVFPPLSEIPKITASAKGVVKAIDYGIGAEKRAMDFYAKTAGESENADATATLNRLRAQEERHLTLLTELRRNYA